MASYNKVILVGNLTRDPDVRYTPKGVAVAELGLAVNRVYSTESGEKREEVTFVDVTLWRRQAEVAGQYLKKGRPVLIEGYLQMDTWDDKQTGQKRSKLKVVGDVMQLLGSAGGGRGGEDSEGGGDYTPSPKKPSGSYSKGPAKPPMDPDLEPPPEEDDIPF